ncbi:aspartyl/asparaginyl beta-hydroxylase domain-containing protein [Hahella aquimaris]|uniref:aspartyl/asparaginyl beta-hydroxylase domain-containing protein n=1 Tax=Hahella sp. HNIBRBA332 TaxID=3015983 RepID=UPI00273B878F|nr:aspartyl/asparaginyl beta-hydroxylase domain-containing protein [Hahella sp. HNIBRBA332]WLQ13933.1 aspartyl/asparaginyl beta-hydroxylase domain-containing protein [Hahella sp. HNIBRBA332]
MSEVSRLIVPDAYCARLPASFDVCGLLRDLEMLLIAFWEGNFSACNFNDGWDALPVDGLMSGSGFASSWPGADVVASLCKGEMRDVFEYLQCPLVSARIMRLNPGVVIDHYQSLNPLEREDVVRLQVPISLSESLTFRINETPAQMAEGEVWYFNPGLSQWVENEGGEASVYLEIDCVLNDWLYTEINRARMPKLGLADADREAYYGYPA